MNTAILKIWLSVIFLSPVLWYIFICIQDHSFNYSFDGLSMLIMVFAFGFIYSIPVLILFFVIAMFINKIHSARCRILVLTLALLCLQILALQLRLGLSFYKDSESLHLAGCYLLVSFIACIYFFTKAFRPVFS